MNNRIIIFLLIFIIPFQVSGKEEKYTYSSIYINNDSLVFNMEVSNLFTENIVEGLKKGMTTILEYRIQLWKKRSLWIDKLITEDIIRFKINYDIWGKRYVVFKNNEKPEIMNIDEVRRNCQIFSDYSLYSAEQLESQKEYIIGIKIILRPLSVENYKEIQRWVVGEAREIDAEVIKEPEKVGEKAGGWIMGLVLKLSGFGDRVINARSRPFHIENNQVVRQEKKN